MKKIIQKTKGMVKGAPSGVIISLLIHAAAFFLAGIFVVFNVIKEPPAAFIPPPATKERPKMPLKKPRIKTNKPSRPNSTKHIVAKQRVASMPAIQIPELSSIGGGLGSGSLDGMIDLPDLSGIEGILGSEQSIGNDLIGVYYDFKRNRSGSYIALERSAAKENYYAAIRKFVHSNWNPTALSKYYRSPKKLFATTVLIPPVLSSIAPSSFGEDIASGYYWMVHYKGSLVYPEPITFRFWGTGDDFLIVRVDKEIVLGATYNGPDGSFASEVFTDLWTSSSSLSRKYRIGNSYANVGDWITLKANTPLNLDIIIGDNGGQADAMLAVEVKGVTYQKNRQKGPILPIFKLSEPTLDLMDAIYKDLVEDEVCLTNGPVFKDY